MKRLFAVLVGIEDYPIDRHCLNGCLNDIAAMHSFLKEYTKSSLEYPSPLVLRNKRAYRKNVIDAFSFFDQARDSDICLFYYSGHGSQVYSNADFWNHPSKMEESLVCYDSRQPGGLDLMDKEIAYLIWKATEGKAIHFLSIMDSCHSGSATRRIKTEGLKRIEPAHKPENHEDYLGFETWDQGNLQLRSGKYVHLAASRENETAKEDFFVDVGEFRGVFTYCLLEELEKGGYHQPYSELINRTRSSVKRWTSQQNPELLLNQMPGNSGFLDNQIKHGTQFFVSFDPYKETWLLNAGQVQNITRPIPDFPTLLKVNLGTQIRIASISEVGVNESVIEGLEGADQSLTYPAWMKQNALPSLKVGIDDAIPPSIKDAIIESLEEKPGLEYTQKPGKYQVTMLENALILVQRGNLIPLFKRVQVDLELDNSDRIGRFLTNVQSIAKWENALGMNNPITGINQVEYKLEIGVLRDPNEYQSDTPALIPITNPEKPIPIQYEDTFGAMHMMVYNTSENDLWMGCLYLSSDYGIKDDYMKVQRVAPGASINLIFAHEGKEYKNLPAYVAEEYLTWGINRITDYLKLFIAHSPIDITSLCQQALQLDFQKRSRRSRNSGHQPPKLIEADTWKVVDLELSITKKLDDIELVPFSFSHLAGITIQPPTMVRGMARLSDYVDVAKSIALPPPETSGFGSFSQLTRSIGDSAGFEILELYNLDDSDQISEASPLRIIGDRHDIQMEGLVPIAFDPTAGEYRQIGRSTSDREIQITTLPPLSRSIDPRSKAGTIKILFAKSEGP